MTTRTSSLLLLLAIVPAGGCYHYETTTAPAPQPGTAVRVHLSEPRSFDVSGFTAHDVRRVDGSVVERTGDEWVVAAHALHAGSGTRFDAGAWALTLSPASFERIEVRRFSRWRTAVAGLLGAVAIYLGSEALQGTSSSGDAGGGGDGGGRSVIPIP